MSVASLAQALAVLMMTARHVQVCVTTTPALKPASIPDQSMWYLWWTKCLFFLYISALVRRFAQSVRLSVSFHHCSLLMFGSYITDACKLAIIASLVTAVLSVAKIKQVKSVLTIDLYFILMWIC
jgi:hypothetical protein